MLRYKEKPVWCFGSQMINEFQQITPELRSDRVIFRIERYVVNLLKPNSEPVTFYRLLFENESCL